MSAATGNRLTVIAADGTVLADTEREARTMENHADRPEILAARGRGFGRTVRRSETLNRRMDFLALRVDGAGGAAAGYVRAAIAAETEAAWLAGVRRRTGAVVLLSLLPALLLSLLLARRAESRRDALAASARRMAGGDLAHRARVTGHPGVDPLARALNQIAGDLERTAEAASRERMKLLGVLESMGEGLVAVDRDARILHLNAVAAQILEVRAEEAAGRKLWEVTRLREVVDSVEEVLRRSTRETREMRRVDRQGERVVEVHACPIQDAASPLEGAVIFLRDITELRRHETARRDFVVNVSHELKTPITAIRGIVETLIEDRTMSPPVRDRFLAKIRDQTARLSTLVTDVLTLSRVESGPADLLQEKLDLRLPAQEAVRALLPAAESKGITLASVVPESAVPVLAEREAVRQMVENLVDNAVKYTPMGGSVQVRVDAEGRSAVLEVRDSGIGIEPAQQARIFERFYRVDKARSRELGGTGLGLSIVKHMALALGGRVSVESFPGAGSTFRIHLPLAPESL